MPTSAQQPSQNFDATYVNDLVFKIDAMYSDHLSSYLVWTGISITLIVAAVGIVTFLYYFISKADVRKTKAELEAAKKIIEDLTSKTQDIELRVSAARTSAEEAKSKVIVIESVSKRSLQMAKSAHSSATESRDMASKAQASSSGAQTKSAQAQALATAADNKVKDFTKSLDDLKKQNQQLADDIKKGDGEVKARKEEIEKLKVELKNDTHAALAKVYFLHATSLKSGVQMLRFSALGIFKLYEIEGEAYLKHSLTLSQLLRTYLRSFIRTLLDDAEAVCELIEDINLLPSFILKTIPDLPFTKCDLPGILKILKELAAIVDSGDISSEVNRKELTSLHSRCIDSTKKERERVRSDQLDSLT